MSIPFWLELFGTIFTDDFETALKEINYTIIGKQGEKIRPLAARGRQRLMGMAITTAAVPLGTIAALETIYDISKDVCKIITFKNNFSMLKKIYNRTFRIINCFF